MEFAPLRRGEAAVSHPELAGMERSVRGRGCTRCIQLTHTLESAAWFQHFNCQFLVVQNLSAASGFQHVIRTCAFLVIQNLLTNSELELLVPLQRDAEPKAEAGVLGRGLQSSTLSTSTPQLSCFISRSH